MKKNTSSQLSLAYFLKASLAINISHTRKRFFSLFFLARQLSLIFMVIAGMASPNFSFAQAQTNETDSVSEEEFLRLTGSKKTEYEQAASQHQRESRYARSEFLTKTEEERTFFPALKRQRASTRLDTQADDTFEKLEISFGTGYFANVSLDIFQMFSSKSLLEVVLDASFRDHQSLLGKNHFEKVENSSLSELNLEINSRIQGKGDDLHYLSLQHKTFFTGLQQAIKPYTNTNTLQNNDNQAALSQDLALYRYSLFLADALYTFSHFFDKPYTLENTLNFGFGRVAVTENNNLESFSHQYLSLHDRLQFIATVDDIHHLQLALAYSMNYLLSSSRTEHIPGLGFTYRYQREFWNLQIGIGSAFRLQSKGKYTASQTQEIRKSLNTFQANNFSPLYVDPALSLEFTVLRNSESLLTLQLASLAKNTQKTMQDFYQDLLPLTTYADELPPFNRYLENFLFLKYDYQEYFSVSTEAFLEVYISALEYPVILEKGLMSLERDQSISLSKPYLVSGIKLQTYVGFHPFISLENFLQYTFSDSKKLYPQLSSETQLTFQIPAILSTITLNHTHFYKHFLKEFILENKERFISIDRDRLSLRYEIKIALSKNQSLGMFLELSGLSDYKNLFAKPNLRGSFRSIQVGSSFRF